ncbi:hypothetical protein FUAX_07150 [Fulvitalea axinellae]|uniref:Bacterial surface antigen (D15) domain-containing protein n=1 Tax=Fulvitalea axinellae TaxID=1182444 RepID=A0AAU9CJW5_9BACT|nr:hypothetical protein FUAX_07150 [Fulvitalea axinellae]
MNVKRYAFFLLALMACLAHTTGAWAQKKPRAVTYSTLYDEPSVIHKLFVKIQPIYGELFATNTTAGYGLEVEYYMKNQMHFMANARTSYASVTEGVGNAAANQNNAQSDPGQFVYAEFGATYHISDSEKEAETRMILFRSSYKKGNKWAAKVPDKIRIPAKVRKIIGARLGGIYYNTGVDMNRTLKSQDGLKLYPEGLTSGDLFVDQNSTVYGGMRSMGGYVGASMSYIRNIAIKPDKTYGNLMDDRMIEVFADLLFMPYNKFDELLYQNVRIDTSPVKTTTIGYRAGINGKFNRTFTWSYGGEIGYRPGIAERGFYAVIKVGFPVFGTSLKDEVEAFGR